MRYPVSTSGSRFPGGEKATVSEADRTKAASRLSPPTLSLPSSMKAAHVPRSQYRKRACSQSSNAVPASRFSTLDSTIRRMS
ncbi:MAG: hypothetical protein A2Z99_10605 [Treponema sp. GWB1_62_6]|nr:MAG: hypothetical protein A2Z99_10605 [Treponema sp. GWB1_62_6]